MAIIPLRQEITIKKSGGYDEWGNPIPGETETHKCRVDEGSELIKDRTGREVVANARILLDKLVHVGYNDEITYTDELGHSVTRKPLKIRVLRNFSGRVWFTEVRV